MQRRWFVALLLLAAAGCAGRENDADFPEQGSLAMTDEQAHATPEPAARRTTLYRDDVDKTVDVGLGYFLQHVEVEPSLDNGRFRGFRIVTLTPPEYWRGVDLRPGDVVTSVNDMPIERDMQAYDAFRSLKTAPELKVKFLRAGRERQLVYRIIERKKSPARDAG